MDLICPLKPELNREKRTNTITQSQLCLTNGEKITAENCNFVSRLNSCPFVGGTRIFFQDCHFKCTDDSLPTSAVYLNCDFDLYISRPFYNTSGTGSVMLGCDFHMFNNLQVKWDKAGTVLKDPVAVDLKDPSAGGQGGSSNNNNKGTNDEKKPQKTSSITVLKKGKKFTVGSLRIRLPKKQ